MEFKDGELIHRTTINALASIESEGLVPAVGEFIRQMYDLDEYEENDAERLGVFFCSPTDDIGMWSCQKLCEYTSRESTQFCHNCLKDLKNEKILILLITVDCS